MVCCCVASVLVRTVSVFPVLMTLAITGLEYYVYLTGHLMNDHNNALRRVAQGLVFHTTLICTCVAYYKVVMTGMQPSSSSVWRH